MDYLRCSACQSQTWVDRAALGDEENTMRFQCTRCHKLVRLKGCSQCKAQNWARLNDLYQEGSRKPIVRYQCRKCKRIIGIFLDHDRLENPQS